jgi:large subunit ribosomal protein L34e
MVQRLVLRRQNNFNTRSNKNRIVKTPGARLVYQTIKKQAKGPRCGDCKGQILGVPHLRSFEYSRIPKNQRTVSRAYGGSRCATCVRQRIIRAFLIEEQKCVKAVIAEKEREAKVKTEVKKIEKKSEKKSTEKKPVAEKKTEKKVEEKKKSKK